MSRMGRMRRGDRNSNVQLNRYLNPDNASRVLRLVGLPYHIKEEQIVEFFIDFNIVSGSFSHPYAEEGGRDN